VSPIFVRPAREQSEHDRLIRHLQTKYKRKFEVAINIDGLDPPTPVKIGPLTLFPDLVLIDGKKLAGLIEVETGESVNRLEVMAQWVHFSRARVPFHLYVPVHGYEAARRLADSLQTRVTEIWTYRPTLDGFDLVRLHHDPAATTGTKSSFKGVVVPVAPVKAVEEVAPSPAPVKPAAPEKPARPAKPVKPVRTAKPAKPSKPAAPARPVKKSPPAAKAKKTSVKASRPAVKPKKATNGSKKAAKRGSR
jgi:hypothetical protein